MVEELLNNNEFYNAKPLAFYLFLGLEMTRLLAVWLMLESVCGLHDEKQTVKFWQQLKLTSQSNESLHWFGQLRLSVIRFLFLAIPLVLLNFGTCKVFITSIIFRT